MRSDMNLPSYHNRILAHLLPVAVKNILNLVIALLRELFPARHILFHLCTSIDGNFLFISRKLTEPWLKVGSER